jgi:DNA-binding NarL/FixJ family response regulator
MNTRMGARPWLAHTQHEYARTLLTLSHSAIPLTQAHAYREKALSLLNEALPLSREFGMHTLEERVIALQEQLKSHPKRATKYPHNLTERELAVLQLIATGKTNHKIGERLCSSLRTVATHVTHIFIKIGTTHRAEAAAYAIRHGLA